jgi:hypothetical protein
MRNRVLIPIAATLSLAIFALSPQPAAASWMNTPAAATLAVQADASDVIQVSRRGRHHQGHHHHGRHHGWWGPSWGYYAFNPYPRRCGYTWSWRLHRNVWTCW